MIKVGLFTGGDLGTFPTSFDYLVAVDAATLKLLDLGLSVDMAVGDFDSVTESEFQRIKESATKLVCAPQEKDDTDTELALQSIFSDFPEAEVTIFGAFGGRLDHLMSNLFLPSEPALAPFMQQISLKDSQNIVRFYPSGSHLVYPQEEMTYVSFMTSEEGQLTISGAKYDLTAEHFFKKKIYSSNEFLQEPIEVSISSGYLIVIHSKDRS